MDAQEQRTYQAVIIGALLHDIGKLLQRGTFPGIRIEGQHPKVSADFIRLFKSEFDRCLDADLLEVLVQRHHENARNFGPELLAQKAPREHRGFAFLVSRADTLSSYERGSRREQWQDYKNTPLASIFGSLDLQNQSFPATMEHGAFELLDPVAVSDIFPRNTNGYSSGELTRHIESFGKAFDSMVHAVSGQDAWSRFDVVLAQILVLLERFTSSIPSNTQEDIPDISLFDHLRTTAAIAACLYQYHDDPSSLDPKTLDSALGPEFLLVGGDASGIQSYIFEVTREGTGRVARRLRARSLYVQVLIESIANELVRRLHLPSVNRMMVAGGKFYLLVPNTPDAIAILESGLAEVERWCLESLGGELTVHLSWIPLGSSNFRAEPTEKARETFGDLLTRLSHALAVEKQRRYQPGARGSPWSDPLLADPYQGSDPCVSCGKFPQRDADEDGFCPLCRSDADQGRVIPRGRLLRLSVPGQPGQQAFCSSVRVMGSPSTLTESDSAVLLNTWDTAGFARRPISARFLANHVPSDEHGAPLTFEEIASRARGRNMLGFLKADVDRLGEAFTFGLRTERGRRDTISRIATLSRMLDLFFSGWIQRLLTSTEFSDCYAVFSGGDDLFVVGPWDQTIMLAERIRNDFRRWVGRDDLTLSAGLVFGSETLPIPQAATQAEDALEHAKNGGRDRITLLGKTMTWNRLSDQIIPRWAQLRDQVETVTTASLYRLLELGRMWEHYLESPARNASSLRAYPLLAYAAARDEKLRQPPFSEWIGPAVRLEPLTAESCAVLGDLAVVAELLIYSKRRETET